MLKGIKIRLYPTVKQQQVLQLHFNAYRWAYNLCLEYKSHMWKYHQINKTAIDMECELRLLVKDVPWLVGCKTEIFQRAAQRVEDSFKKFYKGAGYPKFKSRRGEQSFASDTNISVKNGRLLFFRNLISFKTSEATTETMMLYQIKQCRFKRDNVGAYWASLLVDDTTIVPLPQAEGLIGLDLGIKDFIATSNGDTVPNNRFYIRNQYKLRRLQRRLSKTKKGGTNREKLRLRIARLFRKITWQRDHFFHQVSNKIIRENQTIVVETLMVKNMMQNHSIARSIQDASWSRFVEMLQYKCKRYGRELIKIDTFYPSSKTCSNCGSIKEAIGLKERIYNCDACGFSLDRDHNAAINIRNIGTKTPESKPAEGKPIGTRRSRNQTAKAN